jgi:membrane protease YdiL (CAAX protease family)
MKIAIPILLTVLYTIALWFGGSLSRKIGLEVSGNTYVNGQLNYQIILLLITSVSLLTTYLINKESFLTFFSFGQVSSPAAELKIFGINQGDSWLKTGLSLCLVITGVTAVFMYFQLKRVDVDWSILQGGIVWIILFSLTNSFGEEMIYRIGLVSPLQGFVSPTTIFLLSALVFGLAHINGTPGGIIGIALAGILGFILAKSVFESHGFFWAWCIHFLQDVVIIASLYLMNKNA